MKIMIVDNNHLFREGLISLLAGQSDMEVVGESTVCEDAIEIAINANPDIILMDNGLSHKVGIEIMKQVMLHMPYVLFVFLTTQTADEQFYDAICNGAKGYLSKNINKSMLLASLRALSRGEVIIPRSLVAKMLEEFTRLGKIDSNNHPGRDFSLLTYREVEILKILEIRATNREIAEQLGISENTVRVHVGSILEKLNLRNRREASDFAKRRIDLLDSNQG
jgi:two-component system NarL family response regulator